MRTTRSKYRQNPKTPRAFTLIELLVVLAIISVLLAILIPSLNRIRGCAKLLGCRANLRSLGMGWLHYLEDNDGYFYRGTNATTTYGGWEGISGTEGLWPRPLNRYVGFSDPNAITERTAEIFRCPADQGGIQGAYVLERVYRVYGTSYMTNPWLIGWKTYAFSPDTMNLDLAISARTANLNLNQVAGPHSSVLLMGDAGWYYQWRPTDWRSDDEKERLEWHGKSDHHCVVFLDGHVEYRKIEKGLYVAPECRVQPLREMDDACREAGV